MLHALWSRRPKPLIRSSPRFYRKKITSCVFECSWSMKERCQCNFIFFFQFLIDYQLTQIIMFSSALILKESFQKKGKLATWLFNNRLIHLHEKLFFSAQFKINLSVTIRNISINTWFLKWAAFSLQGHCEKRTISLKALSLFPWKICLSWVYHLDGHQPYWAETLHQG